ncbi:gliding motility-associated ABC transporter substrate-binding protein GldG, partial [Flavobacteriaceae bacterium]|nr:gliding motility-associated ABC transporter substrate-binding protein GldG [Flavobacteriaceae bacterium]
LELGYDKWTNNFYSNKQFLKNTIHYLIEDNRFLSLRAKEIKIALLDTAKTESELLYWRYFGLFAPLLILLILGLIFNGYRLKSYRQ